MGIRQPETMYSGRDKAALTGRQPLRKRRFEAPASQCTPEVGCAVKMRASAVVGLVGVVAFIEQLQPAR